MSQTVWFSFSIIAIVRSKYTFLYDRQYLLYRNKRQVKTLKQLIIIDVFQALDDTERGEGGFGSTGKN